MTGEHWALRGDPERIRRHFAAQLGVPVDAVLIRPFTGENDPTLDHQYGKPWELASVTYPPLSPASEDTR